MADVNLLALLDWNLLFILMLGLAAAVPWFLLIVLNFFNGNILNEIKATLSRKSVKVLRILQNNRIQTLYKQMNPKDNTVILKKGNEAAGEQDDIFAPGQVEPHFDDNSNRTVYVTVVGKDGNINLLKETDRVITSPQKQMGFSMAFEAGRKFERYQKPMLSPTILSYILFIGVIAAVGICMILVWNQSAQLEEIATAIKNIPRVAI